MSLKDQLFPQSNITGKTDKNNQPILEGNRIRDHNGIEVTVFRVNNEWVVTDGLEVFPSSAYMSLNAFISMSDGIEIVVPAAKPDEAPVAMAPFNQGSRFNKTRPVNDLKRRL